MPTAKFILVITQIRGHLEYFSEHGCMKSSKINKIRLVARNLWSLNNLRELISFQINVTILIAFANFSKSEINIQQWFVLSSNFFSFILD